MCLVSGWSEALLGSFLLCCGTLECVGVPECCDGLLVTPGNFLLCAPVPFVGLSLMHLSPQPVPRILVQPTFSDARATRTEEVSHQVGAVPLAEVALTLARILSSTPAFPPLLPTLIINYNVGHCLLPAQAPCYTWLFSTC